MKVLSHPPGDGDAVVLDEKGRLLELAAMPPQLDTSAASQAPANWSSMFDAADVSIGEFTPVPPHWTPRVYADDRVAWEEPMRAFRISGAANGFVRRLVPAT